MQENEKRKYANKKIENIDIKQNEKIYTGSSKVKRQNYRSW